MEVINFSPCFHASCIHFFRTVVLLRHNRYLHTIRNIVVVIWNVCRCLSENDCCKIFCTSLFRFLLKPNSNNNGSFLYYREVLESGGVVCRSACKGEMWPPLLRGSMLSQKLIFTVDLGAEKRTMIL